MLAVWFLTFLFLRAGRMEILSWGLAGLVGVALVGALVVVALSLGTGWPWEGMLWIALWLSVSAIVFGWVSQVLARRLQTSITWPLFGGFTGLVLGLVAMARIIIGDSLDKY